MRLEGDELVTSRGRTRMLHEKEPLKLPWRELDIDVVIESTGISSPAGSSSASIWKPAPKRVVLTVPAKDEIDYTVVIGVNDDGLSSASDDFECELHHQLSGATGEGAA